MSALYVFIGGGFGAMLRWFIALSMGQSSNGFPTSTLLVNLLGCFLIGLASAYFMQQESKLQLLLVVGFLGGFTTFSSFGLELFNLQANGQFKMFVIYLLASNLIGILCVILGNRLMLKFI